MKIENIDNKTIKSDADSFFDEVRQFASNYSDSDKTEKVADKIKSYLAKALFDISRSETTDDGQKQKIDELLTAFMIDNKDLYDNYMTDDLSKLLDFMISAVGIYTSDEE